MTAYIVIMTSYFQLPVGGRHLTDVLARLVRRERGQTFTSVPEMEVINSIKERHAFVPTGTDFSDKRRIVCSLMLCYVTEAGVTSQAKKEEIILPDGKSIELDKELSSCTDPIFSPSVVGSASPGLPQLIKQCLER